MSDEYETWDVAQNFEHFRVDLLKDTIESFTQYVRLNNLVEIVNR